VIKLKIDMLEVKKDRLKEIDKQIKKCVRRQNWNEKNILLREIETLKEEIKLMEVNRGRK
jgi:hypothetical protein